MQAENEQSAEKNEYLLGFASTQQQRAQRESLLPVDPARNTAPFGIVLLDASADVSSSMADNPRLRLLPLAVRWPGRTLLEKGSGSKLRHLNRERLRGALLQPPTLDALEYRLYPPLAINADWLIHLGTRHALLDVSPPLQQMLEAHAGEIRDLRLQRGLDPDLHLVLVESGSLLSGTALQARVLLHWLQAGVPASEAVARARRLREHTRLWLLPQHPVDTFEALQRIGHDSLGPWLQACSRPLHRLWQRCPLLEADGRGLFCDQKAKNWRAAVSTLFADLGQALREHRGPAPWLQISLDGSLRDLQSWPEYEALREQAMAARANLYLTHMSAAGRVWASAGSLSAALYLPPLP